MITPSSRYQMCLVACSYPSPPPTTVPPLPPKKANEVDVTRLFWYLAAGRILLICTLIATLQGTLHLIDGQREPSIDAGYCIRFYPHPESSRPTCLLSQLLFFGFLLAYSTYRPSLPDSLILEFDSSFCPWRASGYCWPAYCCCQWRISLTWAYVCLGIIRLRKALACLYASSPSVLSTRSGAFLTDTSFRSCAACPLVTTALPDTIGEAGKLKTDIALIMKWATFGYSSHR